MVYAEWGLQIEYPFATRFGRNDEVVNLINYDEQDFFVWNSNPFLSAPNGNGLQEYSPTAWLLPYWLGRYYDFISAAP